MQYYLYQFIDNGTVVECLKLLNLKFRNCSFLKKISWSVQIDLFCTVIM